MARGTVHIRAAMLKEGAVGRSGGEPRGSAFRSMPAAASLAQFNATPTHFDGLLCRPASLDPCGIRCAHRITRLFALHGRLSPRGARHRALVETRLSPWINSRGDGGVRRCESDRLDPWFSSKPQISFLHLSS